MKIKKQTASLITVALLMLAAFDTNAAIVSDVSWFQYDSGAQNTPYYTHMKFNTDNNDSIQFRIDLNDSGWGFSTVATSSYHVQWSNTVIEGRLLTPTRSVGWHKYDVAFSYGPNLLTFKYDDIVVAENIAFTSAPQYFWLQFSGGSGQTVVDDLSVATNAGVKTYGFETPGEIGSEWSIIGQNGGEYVNYTDATTPHTGTGSLAVGGNGNLAASLNIASVPEPTTGVLVFIGTTALLIRRRHRKSPLSNQ